MPFRPILFSVSASRRADSVAAEACQESWDFAPLYLRWIKPLHRISSPSNQTISFTTTGEQTRIAPPFNAAGERANPFVAPSRQSRSSSSSSRFVVAEPALLSLLYCETKSYVRTRPFLLPTRPPSYYRRNTPRRPHPDTDPKRGNGGFPKSKRKFPREETGVSDARLEVHVPSKPGSYKKGRGETRTIKTRTARLQLLEDKYGQDGHDVPTPSAFSFIFLP